MYSFRRRVERKKEEGPSTLPSTDTTPPRARIHPWLFPFDPTSCTPHALSPLPRLSINWRVKQRSYRVGNYLLSFCYPCVTCNEITKRRGMDRRDGMTESSPRPFELWKFFLPILPHTNTWDDPGRKRRVLSGVTDSLSNLPFSLGWYWHKYFVTADCWMFMENKISISLFLKYSSIQRWKQSSINWFEGNRNSWLQEL